MRRNYGSYLSELIDQAGNASGRLRLIAAATDALMRWEPRIKLNKVTININASGRTNITIQGSYDGSESSLDVALGVAI
jgi:phage baseplate assembly protein W